jgi:hypothetical protein
MKILLANKSFHLNGGSERVFFQKRQFLQESGATVVDFSMQDERNFSSPFAEYFIRKIDYDAVSLLPTRIGASVWAELPGRSWKTSFPCRGIVKTCRKSIRGC